MKDALSHGEDDAPVLEGRTAPLDGLRPAQRIQRVCWVRSAAVIRHIALGVRVLRVQDDSPEPVCSAVSSWTFHGDAHDIGRLNWRSISRAHVVTQ